MGVPSDMMTRPMALASRNGSCVNLSILGYEFPGPLDDEADPFDANWLMVQARIVSDEGQWTFTHPCLLTWEAHTLADWFTLIANGPMEVRSQEFTEPLLRFEVRNWQEEAVVLCVELWLEGTPPWLQGGQDIAEPYAVDLTLTPDDLRAAASVLQEQLQQFPPRGSVPDEYFRLHRYEG